MTFMGRDRELKVISFQTILPSFFLYSLFKKCLNLMISPLLPISKKCASHFCREPSNENKQFKLTKTWISFGMDIIWNGYQLGYCHLRKEGPLKYFSLKIVVIFRSEVVWSMSWVDAKMILVRYPPISRFSRLRGLDFLCWRTRLRRFSTCSGLLTLW